MKQFAQVSVSHSGVQKQGLETRPRLGQAEEVAMIIYFSSRRCQDYYDWTRGSNDSYKSSALCRYTSDNASFPIRMLAVIYRKDVKKNLLMSSLKHRFKPLRSCDRNQDRAI